MATPDPRLETGWPPATARDPTTTPPPQGSLIARWLGWIALFGRRRQPRGSVARFDREGTTPIRLDDPQWQY
jgi:hypothetical protein